MIDFIDVSKLTDKDRYLYLSEGYAGEIIISGKYKGDRIVIEGASNKTLRLVNCTIESTRTEPDKDGLVFADDCTNVTILGDNFKLVYCGLTFWKKLENVSIVNVESYYANAAIKAAEDFAHKNVLIEKCLVVAPQREGVYFGPHTEQKNKSNGLIIRYNTFRFTGWDPIQFNCLNAQVYSNVIDNPAVLEEKDQWFGILAQKGSTGHIHDNTFINAKRPHGFLSAPIFDYAKELP